MKFEIDLKGETIVRLKELKDDMDRDIYYSIDYDLKHTYKPATWNDVLKNFMDKNEVYWTLINDKDKNLKVVLRNDG